MYLTVFDRRVILFDNKAVFVYNLVLPFYSVGQVFVTVVKTSVLIREVEQGLVDFNVLTTMIGWVMDF